MVLLGDLKVDVIVVDTRARFGHMDFRIRPVAGDGEQWVERHRVALK